VLFLFEVKIVLNVLRIFEFKMVEISLTTTALKVRHTIYIYLIRHFNVDIVSLYIFQVKIQMMSKNLQGYYTLKCLIRDLLSNVFVSPKFWLAKVFNLSRSQGNRTSTNIVWYLYSFCALFVLYEAELDNN